MQGYAYDDAGDPVAGATVHIYARNTVTPTLEDAAVTTDANGLWTATQTLLGTSADLYDVEISKGTWKRRRKYDDKVQIDTVELAHLRIRNPGLDFRYDLVPAAIAADRTLNFPLITGTDTLMSLGLAQTVTAAKTFGTALLLANDVTFPATQVPSADPNTIDDYEEGAWTLSVGGNATYNAQVGRYLKVGKIVFIRGHLYINVLGTGSASTISGVPFTSITIGGAEVWPLFCGYFGNLAISPVFLAAYVGNNDTTVKFVSLTAAGPTTTDVPSLMGNATDLYFSGFYIASA